MNTGKHRFYEIPEDAWLFRQALQKCEGNQKRRWTPREEHVRQWCLHELLRTYGICIGDIQIELSVRVGTRPHRADIVVLKDGRPWIVIECKALGATKHEEGMNQAMSYAAAPTVKATFAVYTNGDVWRVRRCVDDQWVAVPDLPMMNGRSTDLEWRDLLILSDQLNPLLHWLDQPVPAKEAQSYFKAMQEYFYGRNLLTQNHNPNLMRAADNLLRVLASLDNHINYVTGKMGEACHELNRFFRAMGVDSEIVPGDLKEMAVDAYATVAELVENTRDLTGPDYELLRLLAVLFSHLKLLLVGKRIRYADVTADIQTQFRHYLQTTMTIQFGARLPDPVDDLSVNDIRNLCAPAWQHHLKENH